MNFFHISIVPRGRAFLVGLVIFGASAFTSASAAYAATVADWEMNEPPGSTVMLDSSGSGLSGAIGSAVITGEVVAGETAYRWTGQNKAGYHPERLVTVDSGTLNPGTDPFVITVRIFTGAGDQNILQKGQATTGGGMYKIDMVKGFVICMYRGSDGRASVQSNQTVWDHLWHTIRCERQANGVTLTIDGGPPKTNHGATGNIANDKLLSIGGKAYCDAVRVQCDYFVGNLDHIVVMRLGAQCHGVAATMTGTSGTDELRGTPNRDVIVAGGGADQVWGGGGNDLICAGSGRDDVQGGAGRDRAYGQGGGDHLQGGPNDDRLIAQGGNDELDGNRGDDVLRGGSGFDSGLGGRGSDVCFSVEVARSC